MWNGETLTVSIFNFGKALELVSLLVLGISLSRKETKTAVVWSCLPFIKSGQNHLARHSEREKKKRQKEQEVGRRHQGTGLEFAKSQRAVENRGKWRKLVVKSFVVPQRPSRFWDR